ncbi:MAG: type III pantothenate kinase [Paraglaciecola sp.]|uniref:type III pantothenate kinase n=1 Tax=Paraglaciecola sp. TaxID=1920173 RepID=UPI003299F26E
MSERFKALLVDIGNTQIKYALVNEVADISDVKSCQQIKELDGYIDSAYQVIVSSVGHTSQVTQLHSLCVRYDRPFKQIHTQANTLGIECAYEKFQTLGVDRWLAILAARAITPLPIAVLDLGTANTCDIVLENKHLGGWISPGFSVMRESLIKNTQKVFANSNMPEKLGIGDTTEDCVSFGCLASQTGFVMMAQQYMSRSHNDYRILVTGGAQKSLNLPSDQKILYFPNLVLRGLFRLI